MDSLESNNSISEIKNKEISDNEINKIWDNIKKAKENREEERIEVLKELAPNIISEKWPKTSIDFFLDGKDCNIDLVDQKFKYDWYSYKLTDHIKEISFLDDWVEIDVGLFYNPKIEFWTLLSKLDDLIKERKDNIV